MLPHCCTFCCEGKGQLCGEWSTKQRVVFWGGIFCVLGWAVYTGKVSSEPPEQSPVLSKPSAESATVSAVFGYTVGPLMLIYGHRIEETIVILNSLVSAGIGSFIETVQYLEEINRDISGGRIMPMQIINLLKVFLGAFALSTTSLKVPKFKAMMKGGVIADLIITTITDQIPGQFGCECEGFPCSPVVNAALYEVEPSCYNDKWMRWWIKYTVCGICALIAMKVQEIVRKWNAALLAANLCNEAIYDTTLAIVPQYGLRIQPYRMFTLGMFAGFGFMSQVRLSMLDMGYDRPFCMRNFYVWANRIGNVVMVPLMYCNKLGIAMKHLGITDLKKEEEGNTQPAAALDLVSVKGRKAAFEAFKLLILNPATSRFVLLFFNMAMFLLSVGLLGLCAHVLDSEYIGVFIERPWVIASMIAACALIFTSFLGCRAGSANQFKFLGPYSAILLVALAIQVGAGAYIYDKHKASSRADMELLVQHKMEDTWVQANCSVPLISPPFNVSCTNPKFLWYEKFVQNGCEYKGPGDLTPIKQNLVKAMNDENENMVKYYSLKYNLVAGTKRRIYDCFGKHGIQYTETSVQDDTGTAAFCVCRSVLMANLDGLRNLAIAGFCMVGIQVLLLLMSCKLMGVDLTEVNPLAVVPGAKKITV